MILRWLQCWFHPPAQHVRLPDWCARHRDTEVRKFGLTLTRLPCDLQAQKKRVEDMIAEEATIDGLENIECKVFK